MPTLLLADDSVTTQRVIVLMFADESFRVVTVSDGQQAIDAMAESRPDIVLAGTSLPRTNGYELAAHMRSQQRLQDVPLLLLSGAFESVDEARLKASGARGVIEKPLVPIAVISRVKELLGFKEARPASPPVPQPSVSSWDELRHESGLGPDARSVEGDDSGASRADYLGTLDAAFDSLDLHLSGHGPGPHGPRNPSQPLGQASGAPDPRSPGRPPSPRAEGPSANSVFEADDDLFAHDPAAGYHTNTGRPPALSARSHTTTASPTFEMDDEWFAEDDKARQARGAQDRELVAEMGIRDVELPPREPVPAAPAPDHDLDFGLDPVLPAGRPTPRPVPDSPFAQPSAVPRLVAPAIVAHLIPVPPTPPEPPASVADDFAALLALETGDAVPHPAPPPVIPPQVAGAQVVAPEITEAMLDQIAHRVAERLQAGVFATQLRDAVEAAMRDTVRSVVSDTSERLVRDEIERIKSRTET